MDNKTLSYFVCVVEEGTISAASKKLNLSQPPLSLSMKLLEQELNTTLLIRGSRKITCTHAGLTLYRRAKDILALCETCRKEVQDVEHEMKGTIHLGVISSSEEALLSNNLDHFIKTYPNISFELSEANTYEQIDNLEKGIIDVAMARTPFNETGLQVKKLGKEPLVFIGNKKFFHKIDQDTMNLSQINSTPIILYKRYLELFMEVCGNHKVEPNILCINEDARTTLAWALKDYGIGLVPLSVAKKINDNNYIYKVIDHQSLITEIAIIWRKDQYLNHISKTFIEVFTSSNL